MSRARAENQHEQLKDVNRHGTTDCVRLLSESQIVHVVPAAAEKHAPVRELLRSRKLITYIYKFRLELAHRNLSLNPRLLLSRYLLVVE